MGNIYMKEIREKLRCRDASVSSNFIFRFQVNVQFCVDECNPVDCDGIPSYGRRKRDTAAVAAAGGITAAPGTTIVPEPYASRLVYDPNLGQVKSVPHFLHEL